MVLTGLLAAFAVWRWRRKGPTVGLRWTGVAMLPLSLYAIGLYQLVWNVGRAMSHFVTGFVWRPTVWLGLVLGAVAMALIIVPGRVSRRLGGDDAAKPAAKEVTAKRRSGDD